jgi:hypothetical protein
MPPSKMNPAFSNETLKGDYFDQEYTKMSPRLSLLVGT